MEDYQALVHTGNTSRLQAAFGKAAAGGSVTLAFLGGSITEGYSSSRADLSYARRVHSAWQAAFPKAQVGYVNAGIGATGSHLGVARVEKDVLQHQPDVVYVDFSVNDENNEFMQETYEGLLRRLLGAPCAPAVVLLHFCFYDSGMGAEEVHLALGRHYDLPCISLRSSLYAQIRDGLMKASSVTKDMLHPNDEGHLRIAELVCAVMKAGNTKDFHLPKPLTANAYEGARLWQNKDIEAKLRGFVKDEKAPEYPADHFRGGWTAQEAGDRISFQFTCSEIAVQIRRTIRRPAPVAIAIVDGDEEHGVLLDANFDQDWGDGLPVIPIMRHGQILSGLTPKRQSPTSYPGYNKDLAEAGKKPVKKAKHRLEIRILGNPQELGFALGELKSGGPAWIKSQNLKVQPSFDLLAVITA